MLQAIEVKYLPATNLKPARLKAWAWNKVSHTKLVNNDAEINDEAASAAQALVGKLGWGGRWRVGRLSNDNWVFVWADDVCFEG